MVPTLSSETATELGVTDTAAFTFWLAEAQVFLTGLSFPLTGVVVEEVVVWLEAFFVAAPLPLNKLLAEAC
jgi:hypothetical protein